MFGKLLRCRASTSEPTSPSVDTSLVDWLAAQKRNAFAEDATIPSPYRGAGALGARESVAPGAITCVDDGAVAFAIRGPADKLDVWWPPAIIKAMVACADGSLDLALLFADKCWHNGNVEAVADWGLWLEIVQRDYDETVGRPLWRATSPEDRGRIVRLLADKGVQERPSQVTDAVALDMAFSIVTPVRGAALVVFDDLEANDLYLENKGRFRVLYGFAQRHLRLLPLSQTRSGAQAPAGSEALSSDCTTPQPDCEREQ